MNRTQSSLLLTLLLRWGAASQLGCWIVTSSLMV